MRDGEGTLRDHLCWCTNVKSYFNLTATQEAYEEVKRNESPLECVMRIRRQELREKSLLGVAGVPDEMLRVKYWQERDYFDESKSSYLQKEMYNMLRCPQHSYYGIEWTLGYDMRPKKRVDEGYDSDDDEEEGEVLDWLVYPAWFTRPASASAAWREGELYMVGPFHYDWSLEW